MLLATSVVDAILRFETKRSTDLLYVIFEFRYHTSCEILFASQSKVFMQAAVTGFVIPFTTDYAVIVR